MRVIYVEPAIAPRIINIPHTLSDIQALVQRTIEEKPNELAEQLEKHKTKEKKRGIEDDVFLEVTGIIHNNFRFLRDGGDYTDHETGETEHFNGHLFDEVVFNDSIREFLRKKGSMSIVGVGQKRKPSTKERVARRMLLCTRRYAAQ